MSSRSSWSKEQIELQEIAVAEKRLKGMEYWQIARELHMAVGTAHKRFRSFMAKRQEGTAEEMRKHEDARLDRILLDLVEIANDPKAPAIARAAALENMRKVSETRSRLYALDKPQTHQVEVTVHDGGVTDEVRRLAAELGINPTLALVPPPEDDDEDILDAEIVSDETTRRDT